MKITDTTALQPYKGVFDNIRDFANRQLSLKSDGIFETHNHPNIYQITIDNSDIPQWEVPLIFGERGPDRTARVIVDTRPFMSRDGSIKANAKMEYQGVIERAALELKWYNKPETFQAVVKPGVVAYTNWLGSIIGRQFGLDEYQQQIMRSWLAIFMLKQVYWEEGMRFSDFLILVERFITQNLYVSNEAFRHAIDEDDEEMLGSALLHDAPIAADLTFYLDRAISKIDSASMRGFNKNALMRYATKSWHGFAGATLAQIAVEYFPVFISLGAIATTYSFRRDSAIGKAVYGLKNQRINVGMIPQFVNTTLTDNDYNV